jgi:hypothetical protein
MVATGSREKYAAGSEQFEVGAGPNQPGTLSLPWGLIEALDNEWIGGRLR